MRWLKGSWLPALVVGSAALLGSGCATINGAPTPEEVDAAVRERTANRGIRLEGPDDTLPPDVNLSDGVTQEEAVAIALWNSPSFQATLADIGIARADLAEAGLLRNPILSLLFPFGPSSWNSRCSIHSKSCGSARPGSRPRV